MTRLAVGVVLAGGASSRMGSDKALVEVDGVAMVVRVAEALRAAGCEPVWCQGGDPDALAALGLAVHPDPDGRRGPVAAIAAAIERADRPIVVAACDLPWLEAGVVQQLLDASETSGSVAVAASGGRRHLVAAWPLASRAALDRVVASGLVAYRDVLDALSAISVEVDERVVVNVNRRADLLGTTDSGVDPSSVPGQRYPRPTMTVQEISVDELADRLVAGARLVDVREPDEYDEARVPGGVLVPLATVPARVDAFEGGAEPTYVICRSGGRSLQACLFLAQQGIEAVNVAGGTLAWIASGRDVLVGPA